jgi:hypothetical protein
MNKGTAMIVAAGLTLALMAGTVSRQIALRPTSAAASRIVVQTTTPAPSTTPLVSTNADDESLS